MHFAEDTLIRSEDEDEDEERPFPVEKQRLIRKDTPHYKKHFKITKLPKPEAVVALLQGLNSDGVPKEEEELGGCNNNAEAEDQEEAWDEDGRKNGALSQPSVKVRPGGPGSCPCCSGLPAGDVAPTSVGTRLQRFRGDVLGVGELPFIWGSHGCPGAVPRCLCLTPRAVSRFLHPLQRVWRSVLCSGTLLRSHHGQVLPLLSVASWLAVAPHLQQDELCP